MAAVAATMQETLKAAGELGSIPEAAMEIRRVADDRHSSLKDLEKAVSTDPLLAARVLKFANAAQYGFARTVTDLHQAVIVLGMRAVRDVAIGMAVTSHAANHMGDDAPAFLRHSLYAGLAGQALQPRGTTHGHDAFVSGLLHDIGILVFRAVHGDTYKKVLDRLPTEDGRLVAAERVLFGFDHAELGATCLDAWSLPGRVVHAVRHHHDPHPKDAATALLHLSDQLSHELMAQRSVNDLVQIARASGANDTLNFTEPYLDARLHRLQDLVQSFGALR